MPRVPFSIIQEIIKVLFCGKVVQLQRRAFTSRVCFELSRRIHFEALLEEEETVTEVTSGLFRSQRAASVKVLPVLGPAITLSR